MKIYIHCDGGFGNRFNVLLSGLYLAGHAELEPKIIWNSNNWCGAEFAELFDCQLPVEPFDYRTFFQQHNTTNIIHENQFHQSMVSYQPNSFSLGNIKSFIQHQGRDVFYFTNLIPGWVDKTELLEIVVPHVPFRADIVGIAESVIAENTSGQKFYGIHMRKTDFGTGIDETEYYNLIKQTPETKFFICSDDQETEKRFLQHKNVFSYAKTSYVEKLVEGGWNTNIIDNNNNAWPFNVNRPSASVIQALVDLIILSHSSIINTDLRSTFLQTALLLKESRNVQATF